MYVIQRWRGCSATVVAAYEIVGDHIIFDRSRGEKKFREALETRGVPVLGEDGEHNGYVHPEQGMAFHEACQDLFCTDEFAVADESSLERLRSAMFRRDSNCPPAMTG